MQHSQERSQLLGAARRRSEPTRRTGVFGPKRTTASRSTPQQQPASPPPPYTQIASNGEMERSTTVRFLWHRNFICDLEYLVGFFIRITLTTNAAWNSNHCVCSDDDPCSQRYRLYCTYCFNSLFIAAKSLAPFLHPIRNDDHPGPLAQLAAAEERRKENRRYYCNL